MSTEAQKRYRQSEKGKATHRAIQDRYRNSDKGKAYMAKYLASDKHKAVQVRYQQSDKGKETSRRAHLKAKYNITQDEYLKMYNKQEGTCYTCNTYYDVLCVDHDHTTGKVRGLLCNACNKMLGVVNDDINILKRMIKYLNKKR